MKNRIACLILCLVIFFGLASYSKTGAWFSAGTAKHQYLSSGKINFLLTGELQSPEDTDVLPGAELVTSDISLENFSTVSSQLRITVYYSYYDKNGNYLENQKYDDTDESSVLSATLGSNFVKESDGCYYYKSANYVIPARNEEDVSAYEAGNTVLSDNTSPDDIITVLTSLKFDGEKTTITNSGKTVNVSILVESKQADYVTWTELGSITA